jgi:hypothetical protein
VSSILLLDTLPLGRAQELDTHHLDKLPLGRAQGSDTHHLNKFPLGLAQDLDTHRYPHTISILSHHHLADSHHHLDALHKSSTQATSSQSDNRLWSLWP